MYNILMLSGGKDSTCMLLKGIESGLSIDEVVSVDTTKEFPEMYKHINQLKVVCFDNNIKFTQLEIAFDYWLGEHIKTRGPNKGKVGYGWPDFRNRWCTALKRDTIKRYIKSLPVQKNELVEYHGIASDEIDRFNKNKDGRNIVYPLIEWGMNEKDCLEYCYLKGYDWGGLYEKFHRVSCYCCPLSRIYELKTLYYEYPALWAKVKELDKRSYRQFRPDYSVSQLEFKFNKLKVGVK